MADDAVKQTSLEMDAEILKLVESNVEMQEMIKAKGTLVKEVQVGSMRLKIVPFASRKMRRRILKVGTEFQAIKTEAELDAGERQLYEVLAEICLEPPYNNWQAWLYFDEKTDGGAINVLYALMSEVMNVEGNLKKFR